MASTRPRYLYSTSFICEALALPIASFHLLLIKIKLLKISSVIHQSPNGVYKNLKKIWTARLCRRIVSLLVRSPLRKQVISFLNFDPESIRPGAVIISCHTPWARLITQWCEVNNYAMVIGWGPWIKRASIARHATGFLELRKLSNYLRSGGRVIIMADIFNKHSNCQVNFFGRSCNASLFPLRLAKLANSHLVTVMPTLENRSIQIHKGPESLPQKDAGSTMQMLLSFFENEIKQDPSVWSGYIRGSLAKDINIQPTVE